MKRTIQSVLMLVALWGALLTIALLEDWNLPTWLSRTPRPAPQTATPTQAAAEDTPANDTTASIESPLLTPPRAPSITALMGGSGDRPGSTGVDDAQAVARFRVCESGAPVLSSVQLREGPPQVAVHCGEQIHLIELRHDGRPNRIATLSMPAENPGEQRQATPIAAADLNADGHVDLIVPVLMHDAWQQPIGRHVVAVLRAPDGGLRPAMRLSATSPLALVSGHFDAQLGADFVVLHGGLPGVKKPRELWWFNGGTTPRKASTTQLAPGTSQLVTADLDRDGNLDVIALSPADARIDVVFGRGDATSAATLQIPSPGCELLLAADVSGDSYDDVLCTGTAGLVIEARTDRELASRPISLAGENLRSLHTADFNADGKLDLVGYAHPEIVRLEQGQDYAFTPRLMASVQGTGFSPLSVLLVDLAGDGTLSAVMLGRPQGDAVTTDLVIVPDLASRAIITVQDEATTLPSSALLLTLPLL